MTPTKYQVYDQVRIRRGRWEGWDGTIVRINPPGHRGRRGTSRKKYVVVNTEFPNWRPNAFSSSELELQVPE